MLQARLGAGRLRSVPCRGCIEVATGVRYHDHLSTDTTQVLTAQEIVQLIYCAHQASEDTDDPQTAEAPVPALGQVLLAGSGALLGLFMKEPRAR